MIKEAVQCGRCQKYFIVDEDDDNIRINGCPCRGNSGNTFDTKEEAQNFIETVLSNKRISVEVFTNDTGKIYMRVGKGLKSAKSHSVFIEREISQKEAERIGY